MKGNAWMDIRNDYMKGLSYTEIARKYNIDPRTAKKYALAEEKPSYILTKQKNLSLILISMKLIC